MKKIAQQRRKTRHALIQVAECGLGFNKLGRHVLVKKTLSSEPFAKPCVD